jgi:hypothetical protein
MKSRLRRLRAFHLRALFSIVVSLLLMWQAMDHIGWLHGFLLPDRRKVKAYWVGSQRRPVRPLRPVDLLFPAGIAQMIIFFLAAYSPAPVLVIAIGNILLVGLAILPSTFRAMPD